MNETASLGTAHAPSDPEALTISQPVATQSVRRRLILVEDDPAVGAVVATVARRAGFDVDLYTNGGEALRRLGTHPCDLLVTDIYMPDFDGLELIRQIRARRSDLKIIAISGGGAYGFDPLKIARLLGAAHVIEKPLEVDALSAILRE